VLLPFYNYVCLLELDRLSALSYFSAIGFGERLKRLYCQLELLGAFGILNYGGNFFVIVMVNIV
jgi:hypothetical protein